MRMQKQANPFVPNAFHGGRERVHWQRMGETSKMELFYEKA